MSTTKWIKYESRERRHRRIRKKISGSAERPRLSVYRSLSHIYAQVIDDFTGKTLISCSTADPEMKGKFPSGGNVKAALVIGEAIAAKSMAMGITKVVFDRGGYQYHGRVKALAEAARKKGLSF